MTPFNIYLYITQDHVRERILLHQAHLAPTLKAIICVGCLFIEIRVRVEHGGSRDIEKRKAIKLLHNNAL